MGLKSVNRRDFIRRCFKVVGVFGAGGISYSLYRFLSADDTDLGVHMPGPESAVDGLISFGGSGKGDAKSIGLSLDSVPDGIGRIVAIGYTPVIVVKQADTFRAFIAICTHLGCLVKWEDSQKKFICPCHAGTYDIEGKVISGPPPMSLRKCNTEVSDGKLKISLV